MYEYGSEYDVIIIGAFLMRLRALDGFIIVDTEVCDLHTTHPNNMQRAGRSRCLERERIVKIVGLQIVL